MIDEPQTAVPHQHVGVARGPVDVGHERIEPDDAGRKVRRDLLHHRIERHRTRQEVERQVEPAAVVDEGVDLGIRLGPSQVGVEIRENNLWHREPECPGDLAGYELGHQCPCPLPGATKLQHIQPVVICFDDGGQ